MRVLELLECPAMKRPGACQRERELDEPGGTRGEIGTIGRQKCGKVRDYDREVRPWERRIVEKEF